MISLCVPTLVCYDLLKNLIESAEKGTVVPDRYYIIDNGGSLNLDEFKKVSIYNPGENIGVARSWNFFMKTVSEIRVICNDDVLFFEDTLETLVNAYDENCVIFPGGIPSAYSFSCFIMPNKVVDAVGYFDETISPNYAYYEDNDYHRRMQQLGYVLKPISDCRIEHRNSSTLNKLTGYEKNAHNKRFELARYNYLRKWGGLPGRESFLTPYNR